MKREQETFPYIAQLLNGAEVEWKPLGEVCEFSNTGVDKKTIEGEKKVKLLNFVDVFHKQYITKETPTMIVSASDKKILDCNILKGDVFITPSSEILDEIGYSATAIEDIEGAVYSYHIMRLRIYDKEVLHPEYLAYLFSSDTVRKQIRIKAQGITRFGLTLPRWKSIQIPLPPLSVQQEIVRILDKFNQLEAELDCRKRQYEYYRDKLLTFNEVGGGRALIFSDLQWKTLGEVASIKGRIGFRGYTQKDFVEEGQGAITLSPGNMNNGRFDFEKCSYISWEKYEESPEIKIFEDDIIFVKTGSTAGKLAYVYFLPEKATLNPQLVVFKDVKCNKRYLFHYLNTNSCQIKVKVLAKGAIPNISQTALAKITIPIPPIEEQEHIAGILDKFDTLVNSISEGLPREIELRRKQYEYYREKLLSFPKN